MSVTVEPPEDAWRDCWPRRRVDRLLDDIVRDPFDGIGKPEQLRHALAVAWSRRIDEMHRLVYLVEGDDIVILQARYHYR